MEYGEIFRHLTQITHWLPIWTKNTLAIYVKYTIGTCSSVWCKDIFKLSFLPFAKWKCQFILSCVIDAQNHRATATFWLLVSTWSGWFSLWLWFDIFFAKKGLQMKYAIPYLFSLHQNIREYSKMEVHETSNISKETDVSM